MIERLSDRKTLMSVWELAKGIEYHDPMVTGWKPPTTIRHMTEKECEAVRKQWHILVDGDSIPPPIKNFKDMRLPEPILKKLKAKGNRSADSCTGPGSSCGAFRQRYDRYCVYRLRKNSGLRPASDYGCFAGRGVYANNCRRRALWIGDLPISRACEADIRGCGGVCRRVARAGVSGTAADALHRWH
jgi:hypothetical protein